MYRSNLMGLLSAKGVVYSDKEDDKALEILCEKNGIKLPVCEPKPPKKKNV